MDVTCEETDVGSDYYTRGITTGSVNRATNENPFNYADICLDEETLKEYTCDPETNLVVYEEVTCNCETSVCTGGITCTNDNDCGTGALCNTGTGECYMCTDSDTSAEDSYTEQGTVELVYGTDETTMYGTDTCTTDTDLTEYSCFENGGAGGERIACDEEYDGGTCADGACILAECSDGIDNDDDDGIDYIGACQYTNGISIQSCWKLPAATVTQCEEGCTGEYITADPECLSLEQPNEEGFAIENREQEVRRHIIPNGIDTTKLWTVKQSKDQGVTFVGTSRVKRFAPGQKKSFWEWLIYAY